jgi:hypothetical protein
MLVVAFLGGHSKARGLYDRTSSIVTGTAMITTTFSIGINQTESMGRWRAFFPHYRPAVHYPEIHMGGSMDGVYSSSLTSLFLLV